MQILVDSDAVVPSEPRGGGNGRVVRAAQREPLVEERAGYREERSGQCGEEFQVHGRVPLLSDAWDPVFISKTSRVLLNKSVNRGRKIICYWQNFFNINRECP